MTRAQKVLTITGLLVFVGAILALGYDDPGHALFLLAKRVLLAVF